MAVEEIKVPSPGESVTEGTIATWYKADGDAVAVDDQLFELESDKAAQTVVAQSAGVLSIKAKEGETVTVGSVVATIDTSATPKAKPKKEEPARAKAEPTDSNVKAERPKVQTESSEAESNGQQKVAPAARRILAERGINASAVTGTGPDGLITKEDAESHQSQNGAAKPEPKPQPQPGAPKRTGREERKPMSTLRKKIAERLVHSQQSTASLTTFNEVDMSAVMALRTRYNDNFVKKYGIKLGFMSLFVKASIEALKTFPVANGRIDGSDIVMQHFYDIGVAVSTEKGLFVPIIRDADTMNFADIEKKIGELAKKARDGKISLPDMTGGTFTITNGGTFGSMLSTPILNPPQTAILGMHNIQKRAVVVDDEIVIRPMMYLALSYDHRLIDGREAVQFLVRVKECIENPERMLLEI